MQYAEITSNNKVFPVKFGMAALSEFLDSEGLSLAEMDAIGQNLTLSRAIKLVHIGLKHGARVSGKAFENTFDDTCDLLDADPELMNKVLQVFQDQMPQPEKGNAKSPQKRAK